MELELELEMDPSHGARAPGAASVVGVSGFGSRAASWKRTEPSSASRSRVIARIGCSQALGRFEQNHRVELAANEAYERWRASARDTKGRVLKGNSKPFTPPELPDGRDQPLRSGLAGDAHPGHPAAAGLQRAGRGQRPADHPRRGDHASSAPDFGHLEPMLDTTLEQLRRAGHRPSSPEVVLADAGYWHTAPDARRSTERGIEVLAPPDGNMREGNRPGWEDGLYQQMREKLDHRPRPHALRATEDHDRAGLRADQIQPAHRPVHAKRQSRRAVGVAAGRSDPQPAQAPQPLDRQHRLKRRTATHTAVPRNRQPTPRIPLFPHFPTASRRSARELASRSRVESNRRRDAPVPRKVGMSAARPRRSWHPQGRSLVTDHSLRWPG